MTVIASNPVALDPSITEVIAINDQDQVLVSNSIGTGIWQNGTFYGPSISAVHGDTGLTAYGLNDAGEIVGTSLAPNGGTRPVIWANSLLQIANAPTPAGRLFGVNDAGVVVGSALTNSGLDEAFENNNAAVTILPNLPGGGFVSSGTINSRALAINSSNQIVGYGLYNGTFSHAILWQNGVAIDLGGISSTGNSEAVAINNAGIAVGSGVDSNGIDQALSWQNGVMTVLPHLQDGGHTLAYAINNAGIIAGRSDIYLNGAWVDHAVIWQNGTLIDINRYVQAGSGWVLTQAYGVNDNGEVVGMGTFNGVATGYVLAIGDPAGPSVTASSAVNSFYAAPHGGNPYNVTDSAAEVTANIDGLQNVAKAGKLLRIGLTDTSMPTIAMSESQWTRDATALADIGSNYALHLTGVSVADAQQTLLQPHVSGIAISDEDTNVSLNLDALGQMAQSGLLVGLSIHSTSIHGTFEITTGQIAAYPKLMAALQGSYYLEIGDVSVAEAAVYAVYPHVATLDIADNVADILGGLDKLSALPLVKNMSVEDSAANVMASLDALTSLSQTFPAPSSDPYTYPLFTISFTDGGAPALHVTQTQLNADHAVFARITGPFTLLIDASLPNITITGSAPYASVAAFSDVAADYQVTAGKNGALTVTDTGTGRSSTDTVSGVVALSFKDGTDFVVQAPNPNGVTSGNIAELYAAVLGRTPDAPGLAFYQGLFSSSPASAMQIALDFLNSPEYTGNPAHAYAANSTGDAQFITDTYQNLLHRAPDPGAVDYYENVIARFTAGTSTGTSAYSSATMQGHALVLAYFAASPEFLNDVQITAQHPADAQHWLYVT